MKTARKSYKRPVIRTLFTGSIILQSGSPAPEVPVDPSRTGSDALSKETDFGIWTED